VPILRSMPAPALTKLVRLLPLVVLLLGAAALVRAAQRELAVRPSPAAGDFWVALAENDEPLTVRRQERGFVIAPGDTLRLREAEGPQLRLTSFALQLQRVGSQSSLARLRFRDTGSAQYRVMLVPGATITASLARQEQGQAPVSLDNQQRDGLLPDPSKPFELALHLDGPRLSVDLDGRTVLRAEDSALTEGELSFSADGLRVLGITATGLATAADGSSRPFQWADDLSGLHDVAHPAWTPWVEALSLALPALLLAAAWLRALCRAAPPAGALWRASALLMAPAAALLAAGELAGFVVTVPPLALVTGLGLLPASFVLQPWWRAPLTQRTAPIARETRRAAVAALLLCAVAGLASLAARERVLEPLVIKARKALPGVSGEPQRRPEEVTLDAGNALTLRGSYRSFDLAAEIALEPDSVLEVRTRASMAMPEGVALLVSTAAGSATGFVRETEQDFTPIGPGTGSVAAGRPLALGLAARGSRFTASLDGHSVAEAWERRAPSGSVVLLAARGAVRVRALSLEPVPEPPVEGLARELWKPALLPALAVLLFGALVAWALALPLARAAEGTAFAVLPLAGAALLGPTDGRLELPAFAGWPAASVALLAVFTAFHGRGRGLVRAALPPLLACAGAPLLLLALTGPPISIEEGPGTSATELGIAPVAPDLVHFQHPLVRHLNTYLVEHRFRGRSFAPQPSPGVPRVLCLGSSSTWGHAISDSSGLDWPSLLEKRLREQGARLPVEVINSGVSGATSGRLLAVLRDIGLQFHPDLVTISLYYNDSYALSRVDEQPYFQRIVEPDYAHGLLDRVQLIRERQAGGRTLQRLLATLPGGAGDCSTAWTTLGGPLPPPPERFEGNLAALVGLLRERGVAVVLVKEPVRGDKDRLWKREFYAAIDRVGAEFGAMVVDPSPALQAAGGAQLFVDDVHPSPRGNQVMATVLAPVVEQLLLARQAARMTGAGPGSR
jgi:lysophospholipase L1-like esterase